MVRSRFAEDEIRNLVRQWEDGGKISDICRRNSISEQTFYRWKAKYGSREIGGAKRLKQLEEENRRLKQLLADVTLENAALREQTVLLRR